jgi:hypothetical protein
VNLVTFVIEYDGKVIINNEYTVAVGKNAPIFVTWFVGSDFIVEAEEKIIINTDKMESADLCDAKIVFIEPDIYIIRLGKTKTAEDDLTIAASETISLGMRKYFVDVAKGSDTTFLTCSGRDQRYALDLCCVVTEYKIDITDGDIVLHGKTENGKVMARLNPASGDVSRHVVTYNTTCLPFMFLQRVQLKEYDAARELLSFFISDRQIENFFGDFEIVLNNYLNDENMFSIIPRNENNFVRAKNLVFDISGGVIQNIK